MKKVAKITLALLLLAGSYTGVHAQDVGFSQFYANPLYLNPAFAGSKIAPRFSLNYRCQWPGLVSAFTTLSASYDQYFDDLHGGVGAYIMTDRIGDHGALKSKLFGLMYSFRFAMGKRENVHMNLALQASVANISLQWDEYLRWPQQIDPSLGFVLPAPTESMMPEDLSHWNIDFNTGLLVSGDAWYAGAAVAHLTRPNQGFYSEDRIPIKYTVHAGGLINVAKDARRTSSLGLGTPVISPNFIYQYQGNFHYFNYGVYLDWMPFQVGIWYRNGIENSDAFIFMAGVQQDYFKVGYSYDVTVSKLANHTAGAHEITLGFLLPTPEPKHKVKAIRCPSF